MALQELVLWQKQEYTGMKPGLERIKRFLAAEGDPQDSFRSVHIAGTNGKGSTAKMLSGILSESGFRTGLFISPHLIKINERIRIDAKDIPGPSLERLSRRYFKRARLNKLTFFEFITALAFIYFKENKVDIAVLETGLGGRFDATNVIKRPLASIITDVDFDHQAFLGRTLPGIAHEKAGIIKKGCPVIGGASRGEAARVIKSESLRKKADLYEYGKDFNCSPVKTDWEHGRQKFIYKGIGDSYAAELSLIGPHQLRNCGLALAALELLGRQGIICGQRNIKKSLAATYWPGRFEIAKTGRRTIVLDGAHNPGAARALREAWDESPFSAKKTVLIFGMLRDKSIEAVIRLLPRNISRVILVKVDSARAETTENLKNIWKKYIPVKNISEAASLKEALDPGAALTLITGSLYLIGKALVILRQSRNKRKDHQS